MADSQNYPKLDAPSKPCPPLPRLLFASSRPARLHVLATIQPENERRLQSSSLTVSPAHPPRFLRVCPAQPIKRGPALTILRPRSKASSKGSPEGSPHGHCQDEVHTSCPQIAGWRACTVNRETPPPPPPGIWCRQAYACTQGQRSCLLCHIPSKRRLTNNSRPALSKQIQPAQPARRKASPQHRNHR